MLLVPTCSVSDHSVLAVDLDISDFVYYLNSDSGTKESNINVYNNKYNDKHVPVEFMTNNECLAKVENFNRDVTLAKSSQNVVDEMYNKFIQVHNDEMVKYLEVHNLKRGRKGYTNKNKPFWDDQLASIFKEASKMEKRFCKNSEYRVDFKRKQNNFDKAYRAAKRKYMRKTEVELETLVNIDGKTMWDKLKELGPKLNQSRVPEEVVVNGKIITQSDEVMNHWVQCFTELYTGLPDNAAGYDQSFLEKARSSKELVVIEGSTLNNLFTNEEVSRLVHRSKRGKAVSVDLVPNEI